MAFETFIEDFVDRTTTLEIVPESDQTEAWKIKVNNNLIPIGATGVYHPFTNKPQNFVMQGLTGCTAIFVVVSVIKLALWLIESDLIVVSARHMGRSSVGVVKDHQWTQLFQKPVC